MLRLKWPRIFALFIFYWKKAAVFAACAIA
jgi:hypothetical protein